MGFQPTATSRLRSRLTRARRDGFKPPSKLNLIEWADTYRRVSRKNSAEPGQWRTSREPAAYGPYLAVTERDTDTITVVAGTQILKTEFLLNTAGYFIHQDPSSILFIQPTQQLAADFSKERFSPTRETTPVLRELIADPRSRDSGVTITHKDYPGGTLDFVGANSPVDLSSRPKRISLADEIDKYPASAGTEGDPLSLGEERTSRFWNRKKVRACSPTAEITSRIWREYQASDQRKLFVGCPHCGEARVLHWSETTVLWSKDEDGNHLWETAQYHCEACGAAWSETERKAALRAVLEKPDKGWRQTRVFRCCGVEHKPERWTDPKGWDDQGRARCPECGKRAPYSGHAGFQVSKLMSTRHRLPDVVKEFLDARKAPEKFKKFVNTALAEPSRETFEETDPEALKRNRLEPFTAEVVPADVAFITVGADTQDDRIEATWLGWGPDEEVWVLKHEVLNGDTAKIKVWNDFDELLKQTLTTEDGRRLFVQATGIDSQGHRGEMVHRFCRDRRRRRIYAMKGMGNDARGSRLIWPKTASRTKNSGDRLYVVGVDTAKDDLFGRLTIQPNEDGSPTPNAIHFPQHGLSADYFEQLTAEHAIVVMKAGTPVRVWEKKEAGARNEALDCFVYGLAARLSLPLRPRRHRHRPDEARPLPQSPTVKPEAPAKPPVGAAARPKPPPNKPPRSGRRRWNFYG